jgi:hypothetical protein
MYRFIFLRNYSLHDKTEKYILIDIESTRIISKFGVISLKEIYVRENNQMHTNFPKKSSRFTNVRV